MTIEIIPLVSAAGVPFGSSYDYVLEFLGQPDCWPANKNYKKSLKFNGNIFYFDENEKFIQIGIKYGDLVKINNLEVTWNKSFLNLVNEQGGNLKLAYDVVIAYDWCIGFPGFGEDWDCEIDRSSYMAVLAYAKHDDYEISFLSYNPNREFKIQHDEWCAMFGDTKSQPKN